MSNLVTIEGNLRDAYKQLQPGTMLHADQLMNERRTNHDELRKQKLYTADGGIYFLYGTQVPILAITREAYNPVLQNIDNAFEQLTSNQNYTVLFQDFEQALAVPETVLVSLPNLRLSKHDAEFSYLSLGTTPAKYNQLNYEERKLAERVYAKGNDFVQNMKMLKDTGIGETRIWVLNPDYVQKHAEKGAMARASWLVSFGYDARFDASVRYVDGRDMLDHDRVRGVRRGASASEQEAPVGCDVQNSPEEKLLSPTQSELYGPSAVEYYKQLQKGALSGTVMDWKRR